MTIPSLSKQIATVSKVNTAAAAQLFSDRRQNPEEMTCPLWNGMDITGRQVCADSFVTKMEGCSTAEDRVMVENNLRPHYSSYVTLDASGIIGDGAYDRDNIIAATVDSSGATRAAVSGQTPKFGVVSSQKLRPIYGNKGAVLAANAYTGQDSDAALSQRGRINQARVIGSGNGIRLANPDGDYEFHSASTSNYIPIKNYNTYKLYDTGKSGKYATLGSM